MGVFNDGLRLTIRLLDPTVCMRNMMKPDTTVDDSGFAFVSADTYSLRDITLNLRHHVLSNEGR